MTGSRRRRVPFRPVFSVARAETNAGVVYGQPDEGMAHAVVTDERKTGTCDFLRRMDGDPEVLFEILRID